MSVIISTQGAEEYLNVSNRNFATLWSALGLYSDVCGSIDPRRLAEAVRSLDPDLVRRETTSGTGAGGANWIDFGISEDQIRHYVSSLLAICTEAERSENPVTWG